MVVKKHLLGPFTPQLAYQGKQCAVANYRYSNTSQPYLGQVAKPPQVLRTGLGVAKTRAGRGAGQDMTSSIVEG